MRYSVHRKVMGTTRHYVPRRNAEIVLVLIHVVLQRYELECKPVMCQTGFMTTFLSEPSESSDPLPGLNPQS